MWIVKLKPVLVGIQKICLYKVRVYGKHEMLRKLTEAAGAMMTVCIHMMYMCTKRFGSANSTGDSGATLFIAERYFHATFVSLK